ncbi:MAG TPA: cytochrome c [Flavobacteriales bacterium]|nr:cytochrome c [Flavobacteriales bacterium]
MRNELTNIERIERYLRNELSPTEHAAFESELKTNSKLGEEVRLQKDILKGIESIALKSMAKKAYKKYTLGKGFKKWGLIGGGTLLVFAASYFALNYFNSSALDNKPEVTYELPELNENGEKVWADADKYLPYQKFTLNAQQDTVIETQDGIVMAVPANCFLGPDGKPVQGEITLEVKEAIEANDILKAGLNTKSGDKLLETGGMFYVNARQNDKSLTIDPAKGVYTQIPTDEIKPGMQLFEGKRMGDGTIDWVAPKPMEKFLVPVDIGSLNFYPPNYEDTLASLKGKKDKMYKDSLYYSYARLFEHEVWKQVDLDEIEEIPAKPTNTVIANKKEIDTCCAEDPTLSGNEVKKREGDDIKPFADKIKVRLKQGRYKDLGADVLWVLEREQIALHGPMKEITTTSGTYAGIVFKIRIEDLTPNEFQVALGKLKTAYPEKTHHVAWNGSYGNTGSFEVTVYKRKPGNSKNVFISGELLFKQNCASCHHPTQIMVGPALKGSRNRWLEGGAGAEGIYAWINDPANTAKKIPYAKKLKNDYDSKGTPIMSAQKLSIEEIDAILDYVENAPPDGINPSRIKSIWDNKFKGTLIATKEFEERLQFIHTTCREDLLNMYVNNLDKKMCTVDSMAFKASGLQQFMDFASRADGRVKNGERHLEKLRKYYEEKTKLYTQAVLKTEKEFWDKNQEQIEKVIEEKGKLAEADLKRNADNFKKELQLNMDEAYRQLGKEKPSPIPLRGKTYTANVTSTGWKNVDAYVLASTLTRTTMDYTDPETGKKAVIKYEELTATVAGFKSYDRVFAYLIPDQLSSYMRMEGKDGVFKEKLNEFIGYQLVVVGYKGQDPYYNIVGEVKKGNYTNIVLTKTESSKLDRELAKIKGPGGKKQSLVDELAVHYLENKEVARQKKVKDMVQFRERIQKVIFPCSGTYAVPAADTTSAALLMDKQSASLILLLKKNNPEQISDIIHLKTHNPSSFPKGGGPMTLRFKVKLMAGANIRYQSIETAQSILLSQRRWPNDTKI